MIHKRLSRFLSGAAACAFVLSILLVPLSAKATSLTVTETGPYAAIDSTFAVGTGEWRLKSAATPLPNANGTPANASLIFGYIDPQNYYYANYAAATGDGLSGVYRVTNGTRSTVLTYPANITANQTYNLEVRHKDGAIRVYLGSTYINKTPVIAVNGTKLGVATVNANATFNDTLHNLGTVNTPLSLAFIGGGDPDPQPTPPTVQLNSPVQNATLSGSQLITATASDVQGVSSVQFKVDGVNLGAADTTVPYEATWDTTTATNAIHSLTAVATNQANLSATSTAVSVNVNNQQTPPPVTGFTLDGTGPNAGLDASRSTGGVAEWRLSSQVTPTAGAGNIPANFSLIFGYVDAQNFYYANMAAAERPGLSGVYRVTDGVAYKLAGYNNAIPAGQATTLELRYKDNAVRLYVNGTYMTKAEGITLGGATTGVGTRGAAATFQNTTLKLGTPNYALNLTPTTVTATPENPYRCLPAPSSPVRTASVGRMVPVATSAELKAAILDAQPGDTITMADGVYTDSMLSGNYTGSFAVTADGTAENPITLTGSANAVIDGNGPSGRYGLYLHGAQHWNLVGFTVANASKGIVLDGSNHAFLDGMRVTNVGQEAVHFRAFSADNVITNSQIQGTGKASAQFGEGVYIGSASGANWGVHTNGLPDTSDRNIVLNNTFSDFSAEAIDVKEGTSANYIAGNYFEGSSLSGENSADSWIDVKGRCNLIENNSGDNTLLDAYQVHNVFESWASYNMFRNNMANVNAAGYGFALDFNSTGLGNIIECNNVVSGAASGAWNVPCTQPGTWDF